MAATQGCTKRSAGVFHHPNFRITILRCGNLPHSPQTRHSDADVRHALSNAITVVDLEPDADPPKVLAIGPDRAGNLLEVIWLELANDAQLAIHAMPLRLTFYDLLPFPGEDTP